jgi:ribonuclease HI
MCRWALQGRLVATQGLWDVLRALLYSCSASTLWKHVHSHVGFLDNQRADALANSGRLAHPDRQRFLRDLRERQGQLPVQLPVS